MSMNRKPRRESNVSPIARKAHAATSRGKGAVMRLRAVVLVPLLLAGLVGIAVIREQKELVGVQKTGAAEKVVASLTEEQKAQAQFGFADKETTHWNFRPRTDK